MGCRNRRTLASQAGHRTVATGVPPASGAPQARQLATITGGGGGCGAVVRATGGTGGTGGARGAIGISVGRYASGDTAGGTVTFLVSTWPPGLVDAGSTGRAGW